MRRTNESSDRDDQVSDGEVEERVVTDLLRSSSSNSSVTDGTENEGRVETETVESDVEGEPGVSGSEEDLSVLPLSEVTTEISPGSFGSSDMLDGRLGIGDVFARRKVSVNVGGSLLDVALDVHGESRSFGESETEVESDGTGNSSETDQETPGEVKVVSVVDRIVDDLLLEGSEAGH